MTYYLYRVGNGNEGNYTKAVVELTDECPYAALAALVSDRYIPGSQTRKYVERNIEVYGDPDHLLAEIYEGPQGQTDFGASWLTAELHLLTEKDVIYYTRTVDSFPLKEALDDRAYAYYLEKK